MKSVRWFFLALTCLAAAVPAFGAEAYVPAP